MSAVRLDEAKEHLNITGTANDGELQRLLDAAEAQIVDKVGPLVDTTVTERAEAGVRLQLSKTPIISITSIQPVDGGPAVAVSGLDIDTRSGSVGYVYGSPGFPIPAYDVTYHAGWASSAATIPPSLKLAVLELLRHLWRSQRGGSGRPGSSEEGRTPGYLFPNLVTELIANAVEPGMG